MQGHAIGYDPKTGTWEDRMEEREACNNAPVQVMRRPKEFWVTDENEAEELNLILIVGGGALVLTWGYYRFSRS